MDNLFLTHYHAYLLRFWQERPAQAGQTSVWRLSLQAVPGYNLHTFADLPDLLAFLETQMQQSEINEAPVVVNQPNWQLGKDI